MKLAPVFCATIFCFVVVLQGCSEQANSPAVESWTIDIASYTIEQVPRRGEEWLNILTFDGTPVGVPLIPSGGGEGVQAYGFWEDSLKLAWLDEKKLLWISWP